MTSRQSYDVSKELLIKALNRILLPNIFLLVIWFFVVGMPDWEQRYVDEIDSCGTALPDTVGRCNYRFNWRMKYLLSGLSVFNLALILYNLVRILRIKHMEKKNIQIMALYLYLFTLSFIIPLVRFVQEDVTNGRLPFLLACENFFVALNQLL